jgi:signal transduction histidine kinase
MQRFATVRARLTIATVLIVGVAVTIGAVALVAGVRATLRNTVRDAAARQAAAVVADLDAGTPLQDLVISDSDEELVQVIDARGTVLVSTPGRRQPLTSAAAGSTVRVAVPGEDDPFLAVVRATGDGARRVVVARTLEPVQQASGVVTRFLLFGLPLFLVFVALVTHLVIGRALRPVGAITDEVDRITSRALHRRVPVPTGDDEITALARTTNRMLDRLDDAQQRQAQFVSDASHELRSPVATIRQHAEVALAHPDRMSTSELAATVLAEDLRMSQLVDDLLVLARADEDALALHRRPLDLDDVVFAEAQRLRATTTHRVETSGVGACRVNGDEAALRRVVRNLADNAARHAHARVMFSTVATNGTVVVRVDDDGAGVPAGDRERVFERFVRLDEARSRDDGGNGLGLAVAAGLTRAHAGTITVADSPLGGARFEVRLPAPSTSTT